jgi:hypothetical protein
MIDQNMKICGEKRMAHTAAVFWNRNEYCGSRFQLCKSFDSGSGSIAQFSNNINLYKILPFQCQKKHYLPKCWTLILDFFYFLNLFYDGS